MKHIREKKHFTTDLLSILINYNEIVYSNFTGTSLFLLYWNKSWNSKNLKADKRKMLKTMFILPVKIFNRAKTRYQPIFRHCLGAVLQYLMKIPKLKPRK